MADTLGSKGQIAGMTGINGALTSLRLETAAGASVTAISVSNTDFTVNSSTGEMTNDNALVFTIATEDISKVISVVAYLDTNSQKLISIDLDSMLTITHAGEATIPAGDLKVTL